NGVGARPEVHGGAPARAARRGTTPLMAGEQSEQPEQVEKERDESQPERRDRNTVELLNELRIAGTGIQVMFAFLLVVPFNAGWKTVDSFERTVYFVTLLVVALSA